MQSFIKCATPFWFPLHVIVPVAAGVLFLAWTRISAQLQFSVFVQAVGVVFPVLASVICAGNIELELSGHLQGFLMTTGKRESIFLAKWMSLEILAFLAVMGSVILYGVGNRTILGDMEIPFSIFLESRSVSLAWKSASLSGASVSESLFFKNSVYCCFHRAASDLRFVSDRTWDRENGSISPVPGVPGELLCILRKNLIEEWLWELPIQI